MPNKHYNLVKFGDSNLHLGHEHARHPQRDNEPYSVEEAQYRFLAAVKAGLNTKPKPLKSIAPNGVPAQSKTRRDGKDS
jgi:hypothetical protein